MELGRCRSVNEIRISNYEAVPVATLEGLLMEVFGTGE
jgi:hypothetical protein